jgi:hypothetical protein
LVLFDDIIQLGTTGIEILAEMLGEDPSLSQGVAHGVALPSELAEKLKAAKVALVVMAAMDEGAARIRDAAKQAHGMTLHVFAPLTDLGHLQLRTIRSSGTVNGQPWIPCFPRQPKR